MQLEVPFCISGSVEKREGKISCSQQGPSFAAEWLLSVSMRGAVLAACLTPPSGAVLRCCKRRCSVS